MQQQQDFSEVLEFDPESLTEEMDLDLQCGHRVAKKAKKARKPTPMKNKKKQNGEGRNKTKTKQHGESPARHYSVGPQLRQRAYHGTFVVLGATGVGKTTLINFMTMGDTKRMRGHGAGVESKTRHCQIKESGRMMVSGKNVEFKFIDSVGFDAADMDNEELFCTIIENIVCMGDPRIHGVILVHKMERFRSNFWRDLQSILKMFGLFDIKKENVMLAITHSAIYSDEVQEAYRSALHDKLKEHVLLRNIFHINFVKAEEVREEFVPYLRDLSNKEFAKLSEKLVECNDPFNPQGYLYRRMDLKKTIKQDMVKQEKDWTCFIAGFFLLFLFLSALVLCGAILL